MGPPLRRGGGSTKAKQLPHETPQKAIPPTPEHRSGFGDNETRNPVWWEQRIPTNQRGLEHGWGLAVSRGRCSVDVRSLAVIEGRSPPASDTGGVTLPIDFSPIDVSMGINPPADFRYMFGVRWMGWVIFRCLQMFVGCSIDAQIHLEPNI